MNHEWALLDLRANPYLVGPDNQEVNPKNRKVLGISAMCEVFFFFFLNIYLAFLYKSMALMLLD